MSPSDQETFTDALAFHRREERMFNDFAEAVDQGPLHRHLVTVYHRQALRHNIISDAIERLLNSVVSSK